MKVFRKSCWAWKIALACLLVRGVVPAGFMPGDLLAGEIAAPCPTSFPAAFFNDSPPSSPELHHGGHHDGHPADKSGSKDGLDATALDNACPLGQALLAAAVPAEFKPDFERAWRPVSPPHQPQTLALRRPVNGHPSRAPPLNT